MNGGASPFQETAGFAAAVHYHTATLLPSGKVLIAGGQDGQDKSSAALLLYDPYSGALEGACGGPCTMSKPRSYHTGTLLRDGRVLLVGGLEIANGPVQQADHTVDLYDSRAGTVQSLLSPFFLSNYQQTATLLQDGRVLLLGQRTISFNQPATPSRRPAP
jgi:hypothetical protein